ncbi:hypothetical protein LIER_21310 [Lithospermum erythrorhizon]|uniref:Uncharacterized protein n=1 Tax=Lithospermum erythrorhizon TaxID=34254 RepID=A0AAV3QSM8_LITER
MEQAAPLDLAGLGEGRQGAGADVEGDGGPEFGIGVGDGQVVAVGTDLIDGGEEFGKGKRTKKPSVKLQDYVKNIVQKLSPSSVFSSQTSGTLYPITIPINCNRFSTGHRSFLATLTTGVEPKSFKEGMTFLEWREAMKKEIEALENNGS